MIFHSLSWDRVVPLWGKGYGGQLTLSIKKNNKKKGFLIGIGDATNLWNSPKAAWLDMNDLRTAINPLALNDNLKVCLLLTQG